MPSNHNHVGMEIQLSYWHAVTIWLIIISNIVNIHYRYNCAWNYMWYMMIWSCPQPQASSWVPHLVDVQLKFHTWWYCQTPSFILVIIGNIYNCILGEFICIHDRGCWVLSRSTLIVNSLVLVLISNKRHNMRLDFVLIISLLIRFLNMFHQILWYSWSNHLFYDLIHPFLFLCFTGLVSFLWKFLLPVLVQLIILIIWDIVILFPLIAVKMYSCIYNACLSWCK